MSNRHPPSVDDTSLGSKRNRHSTYSSEGQSPSTASQTSYLYSAVGSSPAKHSPLSPSFSSLRQQFRAAHG